MNTTRSAELSPRDAARTMTPDREPVAESKEAQLARVRAEVRAPGTTVTGKSVGLLREQQEQFLPDKLGDKIDPYNDMIRAHRGRIVHTFGSNCRCACGVWEHDWQECRISVWVCRRCGMCCHEY